MIIFIYDLITHSVDCAGPKLNGNVVVVVVVVVILFPLNPVLSANNGGARICLNLLEIVLTPNLHLERLFTSIQPNFSTLFHDCF